jgi:hypothetical protein
MITSTAPNPIHNHRFFKKDMEPPLSCITKFHVKPETGVLPGLSGYT